MISKQVICRIEAVLDCPFNVHEFLTNPKEDVALWYDIYHHHFFGNKRQQLSQIKDALNTHAQYQTEAFASDRFTGVAELMALGVYMYCLENNLNDIADKDIPEVLYKFGQLVDAGSSLSLGKRQPSQLFTFRSAKNAVKSVVSVTNAKGLIKSSMFYAELEDAAIDIAIKADSVITALLYPDGNRQDVMLASYRVHSFDGALKNNETLDPVQLIADCSPSVIREIVEFYEESITIGDSSLFHQLMKDTPLYQDITQFPVMQAYVRGGAAAVKSIVQSEALAQLAIIFREALLRHKISLPLFRTETK